MPRTGTAIGLSVLLAILGCASGQAAPIPSPPRHGLHTVQSMFGGRSTIPMCIVAPRTYVDGTPIPQGTQATIVVYRSLQEGKPGTYTQEVGRGVGPIEREWIDVAANVPCDDPKGGVIYLASSAIIDGIESDLNNQYTTIIWSPGNFEVKEYPAAGSEPGPPASRRTPPAVAAAEQYPDWMRELGRAAGGASGEGGYEIVVPPLAEFHSYFEGLDARLAVRFAADANGDVTGDLDLTQFVALTRAESGVQKVEVRKNQVTGRLTGGALTAQAVFTMAVTAQSLEGVGTGVMTATTDLRGSVQGDGQIHGPAHTQMQFAPPGGNTETTTHDWQFVAQPQGTGMVLLAPDKLEDVLGAPGLGFQTGGSRYAGGIVGSQWQDKVVASIPLDVGEAHLFTTAGQLPVKALDPATGTWRAVTGYSRRAGDLGDWYAGPGGVLESETVGNGLRVRAVGNGMGEVWVRTSWDEKLDDGRTVVGQMINIWIVPVGGEARAKVEESQGKPPTAAPGPLPGVLPRVVITGRVVMKGTREPVPDAQIQLIYPQGGAVYLPDWKTRENGTFRIVANAQLPGGGLPPNEYEVFVYKGNADAAADPLTATDDALWPTRRYMVRVTPEAAAAGNIPVGALVQMDYVRNIDLSKRETAFQRGGNG